MKVKQIVSLLEGFKEAQIEFTQHAPASEVAALLNRYKEVVRRNQATGDERNIDYWRKLGFEKFAAFVSDAERKTSARSIKKQAKKAGEAIILKETEKWLVVVPLDKTASCFYGKDTSWCTTKPFADYYERYFYNDGVTLIYFLNKESGSKWAIAANHKVSQREYFDQNDESISQAEFDSQTKLNSDAFVQHAFKHMDRIEQARDVHRKFIPQIMSLLSKKETGADIENLLIKVKNLSLIVNYLDYALDGDKASPTIIKLAAGLSRDAMYGELPNLLGNRRAHAIFGLSLFPTKLKRAVAAQVAERASTHGQEVLEQIINRLVSDYYLQHHYLTAALYSKLNAMGGVESAKSVLSNIDANTAALLDFDLPKDEIYRLISENVKRSNFHTTKLLDAIAAYISSRPNEFDYKSIAKIFDSDERVLNITSFSHSFSKIAEQTNSAELLDYFAEHTLGENKARVTHINVVKFSLSLMNNPKSVNMGSVIKIAPHVIEQVIKDSKSVQRVPKAFLSPEMITEMAPYSDDAIEFLVKLATTAPELLSKETVVAALKRAGKDFTDIYQNASSVTRRYLQPLAKIVMPPSHTDGQIDYVELINTGDARVFDDPDSVVKKTNTDPAIIAAYAEHNIFPKGVNYTPDLINKAVGAASNYLQVMMIVSKFLKEVDADATMRKLKQLGYPDAEKTANLIKQAQGKDQVTEIRRLAGIR